MVANSAPAVQQLYSKKRRKRGQKERQRRPRCPKAKMRFISKSRQILHFRRRRIYRGVEQPGSSSVRPHIAKNQCVLILFQQPYSRKCSSTPTISFHRGQPVQNGTS